MRFIHASLICCLLGFMSCNNSTITNTQTASVKINIQPVHSKLDDKGTHLLVEVVNQYYSLKNALVASKGSRADSAALLLAQATDSLKAFLEKETTKPVALQPYIDTIISYSNAIHNTVDPTSERQRLSFGPISSAMFGLLKNVELKNAGIYRDYCPMAYNEKGATWLSEESEIKNPYFGKKMLECGEVTDSLK